MREDVMWTWDYELRTLGSWPSERYNGHNTPVEVVTKADHDAALRRAKAEGLRLAVQEHRCWEDVLRTEYRNVPTFEAWIDARAAQIEEGEEKQS